MSFQVGQKAEKIISWYLLDAGLWVRENRAKSRKDLIAWDIEFMLDKQKLSMEVKYDVMAARTGNLAIEYFNTKSETASGIMATKSTFWLHFLHPSEFYVCHIQRLKDFFQKTTPYKQVVGGDDNAALAIYPKEVILPVFTKLDEKPPKDFPRWARNEHKTYGGHRLPS